MSIERNYTGIILGKIEVGETDRIYDIYTLEAGRLRVFGRGTRKPHAKLASALENFNLVNVSIARRRGLGNITGVVAEENFFKLKDNFDDLFSVFESINILKRNIHFEEVDKNVFLLLYSFLRTSNDLAESELVNCSDDELKMKKDLLLQGFIFKLLSLLGYAVEVGKCVVCGCVLVEGTNYFSARRGGVLCKGCFRYGGNKILVRDNSIKLLRIFFTNNLESIIKVSVEKKEVQDLRRISQDFLRWIE